MFVTIFDLLTRFIIYMKMADRCAAAGLLSWPLGVFGSFISVNSGNVSSILSASDFLFPLHAQLLAKNHVSLRGLSGPK